MAVEARARHTVREQEATQRTVHAVESINMSVEEIKSYFDAYGKGADARKFANIDINRMDTVADTATTVNSIVVSDGRYYRIAGRMMPNTPIQVLMDEDGKIYIHVGQLRRHPDAPPENYQETLITIPPRYIEDAVFVHTNWGRLAQLADQLPPAVREVFDKTKRLMMEALEEPRIPVTVVGKTGENRHDAVVSIEGEPPIKEIVAAGDQVVYRLEKQGQELVYSVPRAHAESPVPPGEYYRTLAQLAGPEVEDFARKISELRDYLRFAANFVKKVREAET